MIWLLYNCLFVIVMLLRLPRDLAHMRKRGGYGRGFMQRFGLYPTAVLAPRSEGRPRIWIHAVSVGEMFIALRLRTALRLARPEADFVLTATTSTGHALAADNLAAGDTLLYFPLDLPGCMRRALTRIEPEMIILMECELWPNLLRKAGRRNIPVVVANARLSDRSFAGYFRIRGLFRMAARLIAAVYAQTHRDAERFRVLGVPSNRVQVVGNAKYDLAGNDPGSRERARAALDAAGIPPNVNVILGGSTWPGEEEILMAMLPRLRQAIGQPLSLALAPRHVERSPAILAAAERRGLRTTTRTATRKAAAAPTAPPDLLLIDTTGELQHFYAAATVIFIGKSLTAKGGQNPIEPAACGGVTIAGPHMENFPEVVEDLHSAGGLVKIDDEAGLERELTGLLRAPERRRQIGARAVEAVRGRRGAIDRTVEAISRLRA